MNVDGSLNVLLMDHTPPKENALMDTNWTCSGYTLHNRGGPFYLTALKKHKGIMASFSGICKTCGGIDTIFGVWNIIHTPKDCRDIQMFIETKRDIFRKDTLHINNSKKIDKVKNTTSTTPETTSKLNNNSNHIKMKEAKTLLEELESNLINNY